MTEVRVDRDTCRGYGNCVLAAEAVFDLDEDGKVVLKRSAVDPSETKAVRHAVYECPTDSIALHEQEPDAGVSAG